MNLSNITNRAKSMNFIRRLNGENVYLSSYSLKLGDLLRKLATNINFSLIFLKVCMLRQINTETWAVNTTIV